MLKVGITGSIGSGKSTIASIFQVLEIPVYNSDERAKFLMNHDSTLRKKLADRFGSDIFGEQGSLQNQKLANIVFNDREALETLNNLVHPRVRQDFEKWTSQVVGSSYLLQEAALLVETGTYQNLDRLITVTAPEEIRIQRIMERDQVDRKSVQIRMDNQLPESKKVAKSDFVIVNDGNQLVIPQVLEIHRKLDNKDKNGKD